MQAPAKNPHREIGIQAASDFFKASISQQMRESVKPIFQGVTDDHVAFDIYEGYAGRTIMVVIDEMDELLAVGDSTRGEPDQLGLLDDDGKPTGN